jgi:hypothetical protein
MCKRKRERKENIFGLLSESTERARKREPGKNQNKRRRQSHAASMAISWLSLLKNST